MNTAEDIFTIWAADHSPWSVWVKPVLFANMDAEMLLARFTAPAVEAVQEPAPPWLPPSSEKVALVINCPGARSVSLAIIAASAGYRPVPLFNALPGPAGMLGGFGSLLGDPLLIGAQNIPIALVEVRPIMSALIASTDALAKLNLPADAPPAFLLDGNRRTGMGPVMPRRFDNRSVSFPTDFPSANVLLSQGITRVLLIQQNSLQTDTDFAHTLLRWQQAGLRIEAVAMEGVDGPREITIAKPNLFRWLWYRMLLMAGLRPQLGGFGGMIPEPSSG